MFRVCSGPCGRELPATQEHFHKWARGKHGLLAECKTCHNTRSAAAGKKRLQQDPEKVRAAGRVRMERHNRAKGVPPQRRLTDAERVGAKKKYNDTYLLKPGKWVQYLLTHARIRNEKWYPGTVFNLTPEWLHQKFAEQEGRCFWLKVPLRLSKGGGPWQISLDRLSLEDGYTRDNVVLTCQMANLGRRATEVTDFALFLDDVQACIMMRNP